MSFTNASYDGAVLTASHGATVPQEATSGFLAQHIASANPWSVVLTLLLAAVVYDQGMSGA